MIWGHAFVLLGLPASTSLYMSVHTLGVKIFFVVSGYLIAQSWSYDPNLFRFAARRCLRIFPALILCVIFTALVIGPAFTTMGHQEYFAHLQYGDYFWNIFLKPRYVLPLVFADNPYAHAVNGSLWTLPVEFVAYFVAPILVIISRLRWIGLPLIVAFITAWMGLDIWGRDVPIDIRNQHIVWGSEWLAAAQLMTYFWIGSAVAIYRLERFLRMDVAIVTFVLFAMIPFDRAGLSYWPGIILIPYLTLTFALIAPANNWFRAITDRGDYSYGLYLYAFPVQQGIIALFGATFLRENFLLFVFMSLIPTSLFAIISWHLVEKSALQLKPRRPKPVETVQDNDDIQESDLDRTQTVGA